MTLKLRDNPLDGVTIRMAGEDLIVPSLTFGQLKRLEADIDEIGKAGRSVTGLQREAIARVVHEAVKRNYPDVTLEQIENEYLDVANHGRVVWAILTGSGLERREAGATGEATPGSA